MGQLLAVDGGAAGAVASSAISAAVSVGLQHVRSNHLHRESLAQTLRIHEAEAKAAMEYHRVSMTLANEQHARSILQARLMHEENMDLEKRIATRENLRDEWTQLTDRAGTVLIVNTLVLGVAFGMLVDGPLPACVTLTQRVLTVTYFSALASSINWLLVSVRFAMLLRFRVGRIVVQEMKEAIWASARADQEFRDLEVYKELNTPVVIKAACDDEERSRLLAPVTAHLRPPRASRTSKSAGSDFLSEVPLNGYQDLEWLQDGAGFRLGLPRRARRALASLSCQRRLPSEAKAARRRAPANQPGPLLPLSASTASPAAPRAESASSSAAPAVYGRPADDEAADERPGSSRGSDSQPRRRSLVRLRTVGLGAHRDAYQAAIAARREQDAELQRRLVRLRDELCRPWDHAAQALFFAGSIALLLAACLLVSLRWGFAKVSLPDGAQGFPASRLSVGAFLAPCIMTVAMLAWLQMSLPLAKNSTELLDGESGCTCVQARTVLCGRRGSCWPSQDRAGVRRMTIALVALSLLSLAVFLLAAELTMPESPPSSADEVSMLPTPMMLRPERLFLSEGVQFPAFWEPAAAAWWPRRCRLLLVGGLDLLELELRPSSTSAGGTAADAVATVTRTWQAKAAAPFAGVCISTAGNWTGKDSSSAPEVAWLATAEGELALIEGSDVVPAGARVAEMADYTAVGGDDGEAVDPLPRPLAFGCQAAEAAADGPHFWLAWNQVQWPPILGGALHFVPGKNVTADEDAAATLEVLQRWPVRWLLGHPAIAAALGGPASGGPPPRVQVEAVQASAGGGLLLLLTGAAPSPVLAPPQVLAALDGAGGVRGWRLVLPPSALQGAGPVAFRRWSALASDDGGRLFLASSGPRPILAAAAMPAW